MTMRPFWQYYGGKWAAAMRYSAPRYPAIVEPFAGAAGYSTRYAGADVTLIDADPTIAGLWRYLIAVSPEEILSLPDLEAGQSTDDMNVCQEARWLIGFWLNAATSRPCKTPGAWMRAGPGNFPTGGNQLFWGPRVRARIAAQVPRIRHWRIIEGDYTDAPDMPATWFVDPPYQVAGKHYRHGSSRIDYEHLGQWCRQRQGHVMVCENEGASWLPFEPFARIRAATRATGAWVLWQHPPALTLFPTTPQENP
jgi:hypothetical protein